jgi:hypothetical protein
MSDTVCTARMHLPDRHLGQLARLEEPAPVEVSTARFLPAPFRFKPAGQAIGPTRSWTVRI